MHVWYNKLSHLSSKINVSSHVITNKNNSKKSIKLFYKMQRSSQIPTHQPSRRSSSADGHGLHATQSSSQAAANAAWQPGNMNMILNPLNRESMASARQSSIGRSSSISRASMAKPGSQHEKPVNQVDLAQSISFVSI